MRYIFYTVIFLCIMVRPCFADFQTKRQVKKGNLLYNQGKFSEALKQYNQALSKLPDSDVVNFNLGTTLYKTKQYQKAIEHFQKSLLSKDEDLRQKAYYNLGNAEYKFGISKENTDLNSAVDLLEKALHHYQSALELDSQDKDAKYNYEFVNKELKRLKEKLNKQQQNKVSQKQNQQPAQKNKQKRQGQTTNLEQKENQKQLQSAESQEKKQPQSQGQKNQKQTQQQVAKQNPASKNKEASATENRQARQGKMSEKEALMLLDDYSSREEPQSLYKGKIPTRGLPQVEKDW